MIRWFLIVATLGLLNVAAECQHRNPTHAPPDWPDADVPFPPDPGERLGEGGAH